MLLRLSSRLTTGVAPWRDPGKVAIAVRGWIESSLASAWEDGHAVLVALLDGQVAGMVSLAGREHFTGDLDAYVGELVIGDAMEGRGAGRALMAAAEQRAASWGLPRITLETGTRNHRARRFYQRIGFEEEDIRLTKAVTWAGIWGLGTPATAPPPTRCCGLRPSFSAGGFGTGGNTLGTGGRPTTGLSKANWANWGMSCSSCRATLRTVPERPCCRSGRRKAARSPVAGPG